MVLTIESRRAIASEVEDLLDAAATLIARADQDAEGEDFESLESLEQELGLR